MRKTDMLFGALMIPFLLEATFIPQLTIEIPGSPLSFGRICLVLLALATASLRGKSDKRTNFELIIYLLVFGTFVGTLFSNSISNDLISYLGFALLFISAIRAYPVLRIPVIQKMIRYFFIIGFIYWVYYVWNRVLGGGGFATYGEIYRKNRTSDLSLINYHSFGLFLSCAVVYLAQTYGWLRKLSLKGLSVMLLGLATIFVTESRANLLTTILALLFFYIVNNRASIKVIVRLAILFLVFSSVFGYFMGLDDRLNRRYDINNTEYIEQSTGSRVVFIGLVIENMVRQPFGGGPKNNRVNFFGIMFQPHNQYLTFILFAGVFGLLVDIWWIGYAYKTIRRVIRANLDYLKPLLSSLLITMLILFTNDLSGAFFLFIVMIQTWMAKELSRLNLI